MTIAKPQPEMTIVVEGNRIASIGKSGKVRIPKDAQIVDASGKFLIPGLWDMHVHTLREDRLGTFFPLFVTNGVTGVRDMSSTLANFDRLKQWRNEIADGTRLGPRIVAGGPLIDGPKPAWADFISVGTAAEGRAAVRTLKQHGVDFIKVYSGLPRDVYLAIADEAKRQGLTFVGHVPNAVSVAEASDAGQRSVEHLFGVVLGCSRDEAALRAEAVEEMSKPNGPASLAERWVVEIKSLDTYDENKAKGLFERFARNHTWQVPTLVILRAFSFYDDPALTGDARLKYVSPQIRGEWEKRREGYLSSATKKDIANRKRLFLKQLGVLGAMRRAGVEVMAGTDTPNPYALPGFGLHDELALLVRAGLTPLEALQAATINPAKFLGREKDLGTIERGKLADLVLLDANPLEDISNTKKINAVVLNGRFLDRKTLDGMLADVETEASKK